MPSCWNVPVSARCFAHFNASAARLSAQIRSGRWTPGAERRAEREGLVLLRREQIWVGGNGTGDEPTLWASTASFSSWFGAILLIFGDAEKLMRIEGMEMRTIEIDRTQKRNWKSYTCSLKFESL